jgi:hypothetical protein
MGDTPAPLDPSKVKAGDTVTIHVVCAHPFDVTGEVYDATGSPFPGTAGLSVGTVSLESTSVILTAHQPAPKPEWKPGTSGTATVRGHEDIRGMWVRHVVPTASYDRAFISDDGISSRPDYVTDFVPDETRPLPTREERAKLVDLLIAWSNDHADEWDTADKIIALLRGESR